jgi:ribosomal protein L11 methylase PrmA
LATHIHFHAKSQKYFGASQANTTKARVTRLSFMGLVDSLESAVKKVKCKSGNSEWSDYYRDTNYSSEGLHHKALIVSSFLDRINPRTLWDLGANVGMFSRICSDKDIQVLSFDVDHNAVEKNYSQCIAKGEKNILPLLLDLTNPSPGTGWQNEERMPLLERGPADAALALALIHHLAISNNLPFSKIVDFLSKICNSLIIEFVPKEDSQTKKLLSTRIDIFPNYSQKSFENEFEKAFFIRECIKVKDSHRSLYLMQNKN